MIIDIYTSTKDGSKYLSVEKGTKVESLELPDSVDGDLLTLSPFKTRLEINKSKMHKALEQNDIIRQIETNGYAAHGSKIVIQLAKK